MHESIKRPNTRVACSHAIIHVMTSLSRSQTLALCMSRHPRLGENSGLGNLNPDLWTNILQNFVVRMSNFEQLSDIYQRLIAGEKMTYQFRITIGNLEHAIGTKELDILEEQIWELECEMCKRTRYVTSTLETYMQELRVLQKEMEDDFDEYCAGMREDY